MDSDTAAGSLRIGLVPVDLEEEVDLGSRQVEGDSVVVDRRDCIQTEALLFRRKILQYFSLDPRNLRMVDC